MNSMFDLIVFYVGSTSRWTRSIKKKSINRNLHFTAVMPSCNGKQMNCWNCDRGIVRYSTYFVDCTFMFVCFILQWLPCYVETKQSFLLISCHLRRAINGTWEYVELVSVDTSPMAMYAEDFAVSLLIRRSCVRPVVMLLTMIWHLDNWCCEFINRNEKKKEKSKRNGRTK